MSRIIAWVIWVWYSSFCFGQSYLFWQWLQQLGFWLVIIESPLIQPLPVVLHLCETSCTCMDCWSWVLCRRGAFQTTAISHTSSFHLFKSSKIISTYTCKLSSAVTSARTSKPSPSTTCWSPKLASSTSLKLSFSKVRKRVFVILLWRKCCTVSYTFSNGFQFCFLPMLLDPAADFHWQHMYMYMYHFHSVRYLVSSCTNLHSNEGHH